MKKKIIIVVVILVVLFITYKIYKNYQRKRDIQAVQTQMSIEQTNGNGLFSYFTNLFNSNNSESDGVSQEEALEVSKTIANLLELDTETTNTEANILIQELFTNGWEYVRYNEVRAVATTT